MRQVAIAVGGLVVFAVLVLALFAFVVSRQDGDQQSLTLPVEVTILSSEPTSWGSGTTSVDGHHVDYTYTVDGTPWQHRARLPSREWRPGDELQGCADPDDPARHGLVLIPEAQCGEPVDGSVRHADPA